MATFLPLQNGPTAPQPHHNFVPNSPDMSYKNNPPQQTSSANASNQSSIHDRTPTDLGENAWHGYPSGNGSMEPPLGQPVNMAAGAPRHRNTMSMGALPFDSARSPPNAKNLANVKQAKLAPSRILPTSQASIRPANTFPRYVHTSGFKLGVQVGAKAEIKQGNCKFGAKCALAHVLPNGRRVNRPNVAVAGPLNLGGRVDPQVYHHQDSALANSLLAQQANGDLTVFGHQYPAPNESDFATQVKLQPISYDTLPSIDVGHTSHPGSKYGSPPEEGRLALSPVGHLSALDAPMPASFDSQGISYMARHGPVAASVPSKFGLESPPSSLPRKVALPTNAFRNLHDSTFGVDTRSKTSNLGSSPLGSGDEGYSQRAMHSQRVAKPKMMSSSLPRVRANDEWDEGFIFGGEEDFLPTSLHDLLTPQEKMRRLSRTEQDERAFRESSSGIGTPADSSSQVGSPSHASPSRYGALFAKQRREEQAAQNAVSAFGHVGSPLRNASMPAGKATNLRTNSSQARSGDVSPYFASPPRQSSMSMISQQLARTRISSKGDPAHSESGGGGGSHSLHPGSARNHNQNSSNTRAVSSSSVGTSRIDEEQGEGVFPMEEEEENNRKRYSGGPWNEQHPASGSHSGRPSPQLGPIGGGRNRASEAEKISKEYWT
ncbi:MAG: hypothetical protein Q9167_001706 [Letrouitia subvulpina]